MNTTQKLPEQITLTETADKLNLQKETSNNGEHNYYCPVHDNTTPDMYITPSQGSFVCFGGGQLEGGHNPVTLVMHCKNYNKKQAINWLLEQFGIENTDQYTEEQIKEHEQANKALEKAAELTHGQLTQTDKIETIQEERNLSKDTIEEMRIGIFNDQVDQTLRQRFKKQTLLNTGLYGQDQDSGDIYPIIKNRVTFPYERHGQVQYFIGRRTKEQEQYWLEKAENNKDELIEIMENPETDAETLDEAKYKWLSKQSGKYVKIRTTDYNDHILYQHHQHEDTLLITEGVYDAISSYQAGYSTVSPVTTRFKDSDIEKVVKQAQHYDKVYIAMDGDTAGKEGAKKTARKLAEQMLEPEIVQLGSGVDLDDWTTENGYQLQSLLNGAENFIDQHLDKFEDAGRMKTTKLKHQLFDIIKEWSSTQRNAILGDQRITGSKREKKKEYQEYINQQTDDRHKETQTDTDVETQDGVKEDDSITDVLMVKDEEFGLNPVTSVEITELSKTIQETKMNKEGVIHPEPLKKVYTLKTGRGSEQQEIKLLTSPDTSLNLGDNKLPLKQADITKPEYRNLQYFNDLYTDATDGVEDPPSYDQWLRQKMEENLFLEVADRLTEETKALVKEEITPEKLLEITEYYLDYGFSKDPKLKTVMYPKIIKADKSQLGTKQVMPYNPHTQLWTNTKVGKSYTADMVGLNIDDATPAGLLGYVNADDGKHTGTIDNTAESIHLDEVNYGSSSRQLNDKLLSLMETGVATQNKAGYSLVTRFWGDITYMANPQDRDDDVSANELVERFEQVIEQLGQNTQAMASRFGVVVFDEDMQTAEGQKIEADQGEKLEMLTQYLKEELSKIYTELLFQCNDFLESEYPDEYLERVESLAEEIISDKVSEFWKNHGESYRHARGMALKIATYRNMGSLLQHFHDSDKDNSNLSDLIQDDLEGAMEEVMQINQESLENMVDVSTEESVKGRCKGILESQDPQYLEAFAKGVTMYAANNQIEDNQYTPVSVMKQLWSEEHGRLGFEGSHYSTWSNVTSKVKENRVKYNDLFENRYGVRLVERSGVLMWKVVNKDRFEPFVRAVQEFDKGTEQVDPDQIEIGEGSKDVRAVKETVRQWKKDNGFDAEISMFDLMDKCSRDVSEETWTEVLESLSSDGQLILDSSNMKVMNL